MFCVDRVLKITELISFIGINGVIRDVRSFRTLSDIRDGLQEGGRALVGILLSSDL